MKISCERCGLTLPADSIAYVCSHECTFCPVCFSNVHGICPHCAGELVRRPRRMVPLQSEETTDEGAPQGFRSWIVWALSFGVWTFVALAYALTVYELYRSTGGSMSFLSVLGMQSSQVLTYIPLTPFVFTLANRFQVQRSNWVKNSLILLAGGLVFTVAQVALRGITPYAYWDPRVRHWVVAFFQLSPTIGKDGDASADLAQRVNLFEDSNVDFPEEAAHWRLMSRQFLLQQ